MKMVALTAGSCLWLQVLFVALVAMAVAPAFGEHTRRKCMLHSLLGKSPERTVALVSTFSPSSFRSTGTWSGFHVRAGLALHCPLGIILAIPDRRACDWSSAAADAVFTTKHCKDFTQPHSLHV